MRKLNCFFLILTLLAALMTGGVAETGDGAWDCPNCGRTGNTGNFCGGCGQPKPDKAEATDPETASYRKRIDRMEAAFAQNPLKCEDIEKALIEVYGSAEALKTLQKEDFHWIEYGDTYLAYWHNDDVEIFLINYADKSGNTVFQREYVRTFDTRGYDTSKPTYKNKFDEGAEVDLVTSSSGQSYYLWRMGWGDQYAETEYYDGRTVSSYIVWCDTDWYNQ